MLLDDHAPSIGALPNVCEAGLTTLNFLKNMSIMLILFNSLTNFQSTACSLTSAAKIILSLPSNKLLIKWIRLDIKFFLQHPGTLLRLTCRSLCMNAVPTIDLYRTH